MPDPQAQAAHDAALRRFMATMPVAQSLLPAIVFNSSSVPTAAQMRTLVEELSKEPHVAHIEETVRYAVGSTLTTAEIEAMTRFLASEQREIREALLKFAAAMVSAVASMDAYIEEQYQRLFGGDDGEAR